MTTVNNAQDILTQIFAKSPQQHNVDDDSTTCTTIPQQFSDIGDYVDNVLANIESSCPKAPSEYEDYRIGPSKTSLNLNMATGIIQTTRSDFTGIGSFNTVRADVCVFRGKWQYEVLLETRGVMQFGWCTIKCHFSQEIGVGDTWTSYSYDGGRIRKWNVHNSKYGDPWLAGDIISCLIDCDEGTISFKRNGNDLGVAFENIPFGRGIAYFPAISLSQNERVQINFGALPFRHPTPNYLPIDDKPRSLVEQSNYLLNIFEQIIHLGKSSSRYSSYRNSFQTTTRTPSIDPKTNTILMIIAQHILERLAPLVSSSYVVHQCVIPMLMKLKHDSMGISLFLDYFWAFFEPNELTSFLSQLFFSLSILYFFEPVQLIFEEQRQYLHLLHALLRHEDTRKLSLKSIFFQHVKLPLFIDIKPPDSEILKQIIPEGWLKKKLNYDDLERDLSYLPACRKLKEDLQALENLQIEILKLILTPSDVIQNPPSSKYLFITNFRVFLKENLTESPIHSYQPGIIRNLFHRLLQVLEFYWNEYHRVKSSDEGEESSLPFEQAYVPSHKFIDNNLDYFNLQRLGGVQSHLEKEYSADLKRARSSRASTTSTATSSYFERAFSDPSSRYSDMPDFVSGRDRYRHQLSYNVKSANATGSDSLTELLDGLIILYHVGVHKHYVKISEVIDSLREYTESLTDIDNKLLNCRDDCPEIRDELLRSKKIFEQQAEDLTRKIAWISLHVFSHEKRRDVVILHRCVSQTLYHAAEAGNLFSFVPEIYLNEVYLNTFTALNVYFPLEDSLISREIAMEFVQFIANHMQDSCIVNNDVRDNMIQSLSAFCFYSGSLRALESMREHNRTVLIRTLLTPYPTRSWAMTNLILVRFWKGYGFGFRYSNVYPSKFLQSLRKDRIQDPAPSIKYQQEIGRYLLKNVDEAITFLNSLLGQLNWAFSEFMGLLKDLVPNKSRSMPNIEHRQMKICSTCFDVTVSLLRTIEMTINVAPTVMLDKNSTKSEMLLFRLLQLVSQIINRLAMKNYVLEEVERLKMFALDNVQPYPIFSAVCGILVELINRRSNETSNRVCRALHNEADLDLSCLRRLIYGSDSGDVVNGTNAEGHFSLISQPEIDSKEAKELEDLCRRLNDVYQKIATTATTTDNDDESMCIICYSHRIQGEFRPCKHQACLSCINMHFMTSNECFFCKTRVEQVVDSTTGLIVDGIKPNENPSKDK